MAERPLAVAICSRRRGQNGESVETAAGSWREECGDGLDGGGALRWRGGCDERSPAEARRARAGVKGRRGAGRGRNGRRRGQQVWAVGLSGGMGVLRRGRRVWRRGCLRDHLK